MGQYGHMTVGHPDTDSLYTRKAGRNDRLFCLIRNFVNHGFPNPPQGVTGKPFLVHPRIPSSILYTAENPDSAIISAAFALRFPTRQ